MVRSFFVYGTLKTGQCRCQLWPCQPTEVCNAWTRAKLFSRDDYPAMRRGADRVAGELWRFAEQDVPTVLDTLDQIEGTNQPGQPDLYVRVTVETWSGDGDPLGMAYTYLYATEPEKDGFIRISPDQQHFARWPSSNPSP